MLVAEWLSAALEKVHAKWRKICRAIDLKRHEQITSRIAASQGKSKITDFGQQAAVQLNNVYAKLLRKEYTAGMEKLNKDLFPSEELKQSFLTFCEQLTDDDMAIIHAAIFK